MEEVVDIPVDAGPPSMTDPGSGPVDGIVAEPPPMLDLGASCTLTDVATLRTACIAALEAKDPPTIDGTRVERVDAAGIQVLVGFTIDCMERSINFSWSGRSPELKRGIQLLGVEALLESPGAAASPTGGVA
jgi:anti-anti-sigma regulatory factor